jgi:hypothetical protein
MNVESAEEWELPAHRRGINPKKGITSGIICSLTLVQTGRF